ncbi:MAG: MarR family transcriptional regulator [Proteobacteria bacterium]|jgi:DNA-binding MarR family transcriptional regulator|nr:MarR family transcriptional regulator [Pseudomonadota bacterium]MBK9253318.1 MarR family transcriptional regulator [Pseudomonadota bacterium]MCC6632228.1 MarR family transcriptional regulator [Gammaproteobacteria bacterium]
MNEELQRLQRIGWLFRAVNVAFREAIDAALKRDGVGLAFSQVSTLSILDTYPGINGAQLARHNMVTPQAMTAVLRLLVQKKLIERREHPDSQRADSWHVTARGEQVLGRGRASFAAVTRQMLGDMASDQVDALESLLASCGASLEDSKSNRRGIRAGAPRGRKAQPSVKSLV